MKADATLTTARLLLRRPAAPDVAAIFARYASDPEVTRMMGWSCHRSIDDTRLFLDFSATQWERWPAGPYLIESRSDGRLLGSTGLEFEAADVAMTGYVLARDAWGQGYATEALQAMIELARQLGLRRLYALCHVEHVASRRVLEKCGLRAQSTLQNPFPNLPPDARREALRYELEFTATAQP